MGPTASRPHGLMISLEAESSRQGHLMNALLNSAVATFGNFQRFCFFIPAAAAVCFFAISDITMQPISKVVDSHLGKKDVPVPTRPNESSTEMMKALVYLGKQQVHAPSPPAHAAGSLA